MKNNVKKIIKKILPYKWYISIKCIHQSVIEKMYNFYVRIYLRKRSKEKKDGCILFVCQFQSIWNKSEGVFLELKKINANAKILVVPDKKYFGEESSVFDNYKDDVIYYYKGCLQRLNPSLVLYSRPYDILLPEDLRSYNVIKRFKTGFIPYYYSLETNYDFSIGPAFSRNIILFFADQDATKMYFENHFRKNIKLGLQRVYSIGYPSLEAVIQRLNAKSCVKSIYKNKNRIHVMWTPRWTMDEKVGGSNFLKYYKQIFQLMNGNEHFSFVFRPHPMLFEFFISHGYLSKSEYQEIMTLFEKSTNMSYDKSGEYLDTFIDTDILISDNSSIIVEYLLTGKPMIYCYNDSSFIFNDIMKQILECNYVANDWKEVLDYLQLLCNGTDSKATTRSTLCKKMYEQNQGACQRIAKTIVDDIS